MNGCTLAGMLALSAGCGLALGASPAKADAASAFYVGGGASRIDARGRETVGNWQLDAGVGTSPGAAASLGGLLRLQWHLPDRPDFALLARGVSRGFAAGGFGVGAGLGPFARGWGQSSVGVMGEVVLGGPFGLTALVGGGLGSSDTRTYFVSLGIDLARLTVHQVAYASLWPNPFPSPRP